MSAATRSNALAKIVTQLGRDSKPAAGFFDRAQMHVPLDGNRRQLTREIHQVGDHHAMNAQTDPAANFFSCMSPLLLPRSRKPSALSCSDLRRAGQRQPDVELADRPAAGRKSAAQQRRGDIPGPKAIASDSARRPEPIPRRGQLPEGRAGDCNTDG